MATNVIARDSLIGMVAGPLIWAAHFVTCYTVVALACAFGFGTEGPWSAVTIALVIVSAVALALIAALTLLAYRRWRQAGSPGQPREPVQARHRFMAVSGMLLCILSGISLVYVSVPLFILSPCQ